MSFVPMDLIMASKYREFPDAIWTLELARKEAQLDKRSVPVALRHCARAIAPRAANKSLRATLDGIATSPFPETGLRMLKSCLEKMENKLEKEMRGKQLERADLEELARLSEES